MSTGAAFQPAKIGPFDIDPQDWQMLVRHVKAFSGFSYTWNDVMFAIAEVDEGVKDVPLKRNRLFLLPEGLRSAFNFADDIVKMPGLMAFGYVRAPKKVDDKTLYTVHETEETEDFLKRKLGEGAQFKKDSLLPEEQDIILSVAIDSRLKKPIYYIIMDRKFEYHVYKTPMEKLFGILEPVKQVAEEKPESVVRNRLSPKMEEPEPSVARESVQGKAEVRYPFECQSCSEKFKSISEAKSHVESNKGHKIFRIER
jgi:hypothetical protein